MLLAPSPRAARAPRTGQAIWTDALLELLSRLDAGAPPLTLLDWAHERFEWLILPGVGFHEHRRMLVCCRDPARLRAAIAAARNDFPLLAVF